MRSRRSVGILASLVLAGLVGFGLAGGCAPIAETTASTTSEALGNPTVSVDPPSFLFEMDPAAQTPPVILCTGQPGGMQSYVATVTDMGPIVPEGAPLDAPYPLTLPSSPPTPCSQSVYFAAAIEHHYEAVVDGYVQPADELVPLCSVAPNAGANAPASGGACTHDTECFADGCFGLCLRPDAITPCSPGSLGTCECIYTPALGDRHMLAPGTSKLVTPRWTSPADLPCGFGTNDVASPFTNVSITPCGALVDALEGSTTGLEIVPAAALDMFACAPTGTVTSVDVLPDDPELVPKPGLACGSTFTYKDLTPGQAYGFVLDGHENGKAAPTLQASCTGKTVAGLILDATCDPFTPIPAKEP